MSNDHERETVLEPGEVVTGVEVPAPGRGVRSSYTKFRSRESWDFAMVSVGLMLRVDGGTVQGGRIALGGVAPVPWLDEKASGLLAGNGGTKAELEDLGVGLLADAEPLEENAYKLPLARNLTRRAVTELLG